MSLEMSEYFQSIEHIYKTENMLSAWSNYSSYDVIKDLVHEIRREISGIELRIKLISGSDPFADEISLEHLEPQLRDKLTDITKHIALIRLLLYAAAVYTESNNSLDDDIG